MSRRILCIAMVAMLTLVAASCTRSHNTDPGAVVPNPESQIAVQDPPLDEEDWASLGDDDVPLVPAAEEDNKMTQRLAGLTQNEYDGIAMTAAVLPRRAILPGSSIPLTVTVENTGDKSVFYIQGSGSFETPTALGLHVEGLQPILPQDNLGIATMDLVTKELKPGEHLKYTLIIRAIEPHAGFDAWTYDYFMKQNRYLGELTWEELQAAFSDLKAVSAGSYEGKVYFLYYLPQDTADGTAALMSTPTGYAEADFTISVS